MALLLTNARLLSFSRGRGETPVDGGAVLIDGSRITAVGSGTELRRQHPSARQVDLGGALLMPGWTDTHCHFYEWARKLAGVDLMPARDLDEVERRLRAHRESVDDDLEWIGGGGWDPGFYGQRQRMDRHFLDAIFPDRPVVFESRDFHNLWVNSKALEKAGLLDVPVDDIEVPRGGRVGRDENGRPDGLLFETAWDLIWRVRPPEPRSVARRWLDRAASEAHALGLTGVNTMESESTLDHFRSVAASDELRLRVCFHTPLDHLDRRIERGERGYTDLSPFLRLGGVKIFMDGSLGSRSARMVEPYPDGSHGTQVYGSEELEEMLRRAARAGIPGSVHAIGDHVVGVVADAFLRMREEFGPDLAHRMEHAQCVRDEDLVKLARGRVYCAMQPVHLLYDGPLLDREWGEATRWTYRCRDLLDAGVPVGLGSDAPVAPLDPRPGIAIATSRVWGEGAPPHEPGQALTLSETLAGYTRDAARAACRQEELGTLEVGRLADLTAVDDVYDEDPSAWMDAATRLTVVDGEIVYENLG